MGNNDFYPYDDIRRFFMKTYPYSLLLDIAEGDVHMAMHMYPDSIALVLPVLHQRSQAILEGRYRDRRTLQELANEHHLTRERIRQIIAKSLRLLRKKKQLQLLTSVPTAASTERDVEISRLEAERDSFRIAYDNLLVEKQPEEPPEIPDVTPERILEMDISSMDLSVRAYNCLHRSGVNTMGEIARMTRLDLLRIRNLGAGTADEIERKLARYGLGLRPEEHTYEKTG